MDIARKSFETGIPVIDRQHHAYIDMVERLLLRCEKDCMEPADLRSEVKEIVRYAWEHFDDEEFLMRAVNYSSYNQHLEKHDEFRNRLDDFLKRLKSGRTENDSTMFLTHWLVGWIDKQVQADDAKPAAFLKEERS